MAISSLGRLLESDDSDDILTPEKARELSQQNRFPLQHPGTVEFSSRRGKLVQFSIPPEGVGLDSTYKAGFYGDCQFFDPQGKSLGPANLAYVPLTEETVRIAENCTVAPLFQVRAAILEVLAGKGFENIPYKPCRGEEA
ncbi:MAG: hypothetical protein PHO48_00125 [Candidatus Gracilibacteria bacterium]|nr:hypothetical protein [Candidatus Gracilibacteria bacterium]MDD5178676.1 hypothetical protein [Candidatus Gracilibacteria bacterium]